MTIKEDIITELRARGFRVRGCPNNKMAIRVRDGEDRDVCTINTRSHKIKWKHQEIHFATLTVIVEALDQRRCYD